MESGIKMADKLRAESPSLGTHLFAEGEQATVNLINTVSPVPKHYHAKHDETVVILRGRGKMILGDQEREVAAGDVIFIPQGTVHAFDPLSEDVVAVSVFAPKWDGKDRIIIGL
jgi:quercetin dioxygenase-like cupin family protein